MPKQTKTDREVLNLILANSQSSVTYSAYTPSIMGCIVMSALYGMTGSLTGFIFQWIWLILALVSYYKMNKSLKKINREYKYGR